jgi:ABC-type uncharacterized transport system substrate-binding protein
LNGPAHETRTGNTATGPLQQATHTVPIVFVVTADPVGNGYVASLARPAQAAHLSRH